MNVNDAISIVNELAINSTLVTSGSSVGTEYIFKSARKNKDVSTAMSAAYAAKMEISGTGPNSFIIWK